MDFPLWAQPNLNKNKNMILMQKRSRALDEISDFIRSGVNLSEHPSKLIRSW